MTLKQIPLLVSVTALMASLTLACVDQQNPGQPNTSVVLSNHSLTPALVKAPSSSGGQVATEFASLKIYSLLSSDDKLSGSPAFTFGGSADGAGLVKNPDGTFSMLVNHEDNFSVSRITLDQTFKPVKGEYVLNSDGGVWRLCSASLTSVAEHGYGPVYLTSGESGEESRTHALSVNADPAQAAISRELPALGRTSAEVALPLNRAAYPGKTVIIIGDDDSGTNGGQVYLYMANTVGDLENGALYALKRKDNNQRERDMVPGQSYEVEFVLVPNQKTITGKQQNELVDTQLKSIKFGRVEDVDYRKDGTGRELYFNVTGQATTGVNADYSRTKYGRVYKLVLNENDATKGKLEVVLDGDDRLGKAGKFQNPDNICVTKNFIYVQEDPNGYGDETHDGYIYQYNLSTGEIKVVMELDHRRQAPDAATYNVGGTSKFGDWEYGAMLDVSDLLGIPDTFLLNIQPHTWRGAKYAGVDGGSKRRTENQASQVLVVKGLPR
jgi:hypothetical protein